MAAGQRWIILAIVGASLVGIATLALTGGGSDEEDAPSAGRSDPEPSIPTVDPKVQACADDLTEWAGTVLRDPTNQLAVDQVQSEIMQVYGLNSFEADFFFGELMPKTVSVSIQEGYATALGRAGRLIAKACTAEYG